MPTVAHSRAVDGATFILAEPHEIPALWGVRDRVLWAAGEAFMMCGPDGVGKTTLAQQLLLRRIGIGGSDLLGLPVARCNRRALYIAADRSRQAARSLKRMVDFDEEDILRDNLTVWRGPLPFDLAKEPEKFAPFVIEHDADVVFIDSLKDVALDLSKDETGSRVNNAVQEAIAAGVEICVLHHQRKEQQGSKPTRLTDVYGSRWLTAGMGSVALLWGEPGDPVVDFSHLKQPGEEVGPFKVLHDHTTGRSSIYEEADLATLLKRARNGLTVPEAASLVYATDKPSPAQREKVRRKLVALAQGPDAHRRDDPEGTVRYLSGSAS